MSRQWEIVLASCTSCFTSRKWGCGTHLIRGWMSTEQVWTEWWLRENSVLARIWIPDWHK
jgi:hypothetical protein